MREHGSHAKYAVERCRCDPCRRAQREYNRMRVRAIARPDVVWCPYVDAGPAREHVKWLASCGIGIKTVAKLSGLPHGTLSKLMYGDRPRRMPPSRRIRPATAERVLAVMPAMAVGAQKVPAGPTWRLLDELIARGWSGSELARRLGFKSPALQVSRHRVLASTARKVERLHAELIEITIIPKRTRWGLRPTPAGKPYRRDSVRGTSRRVYERVPRPFPLEPLAGAVGMTESQLCLFLGWNLTRARHGLGEAQADEAALRLGLHPFEVWGQAWMIA